MSAVIFVALGLLWLFRQPNEGGRDSRSLTEKSSLPTLQNHTESNRAKTHKAGDRAGSVKVPQSFTVDELVAIYESRGAAAAIAAAKSMTGPKRDSQVVFILTYLARIDPEFVAGELKGAGLGLAHQGFVVDAVMNDWKDGKNALEWATSNFTGDLLKKGVGGALKILVRTDPDAALAYLETLPASGSRRQAMSDIFYTWGRIDPGTALKLLSENFPVNERAAAIRRVISGWSQTHPADAAAWVEAVQDETLKVGLICDVVRSWKSKSAAEATAWVESLPKEIRLEADKVIALDVVERRDGPFCTESATGPDASWKTKTVTTMEDKDFRNWGYQDPEGARKFLETAPQGKDLGELATIVAIGMSAKVGPQATFDWAQTLQGEAGKKALRCAVILWEGSDPAAAAKKLEVIAPEQRAPLATALAENWSRHDPAAAAAWVATYDGAEQKLLVREVIQRWTDSQPREAYAWLGTLPMGPSRDEGINYLLRIEARTDPNSVLPWIDLISEPKLREKMRKELDGYLQRAGK